MTHFRACEVDGSFTFHRRPLMAEQIVAGQTPTPGPCERCGKQVYWNWDLRRYEPLRLIVKEWP